MNFQHETLENWSITDISQTVHAFPARDNETGYLVFGNYELSEVKTLFWLAPESYLGNLLTSYGSSFEVHISWLVIRGDTSGTVTTGPNVIICGSNGMRIAFGEENYATQTKALVHVGLEEEGWYHFGTTNQLSDGSRGDAVTRVQFMSILSDVESILIRGTFHTDQAECVFISGSLYTNEVTTTFDQKVVLSLVEQCHCPPGYDGLSCESCSFGFARTYENNTSHERIGKCHRCDCNGHARDCDVLHDICGPCEHNTYGERCERCSVGYYGNAMFGSPLDCQRCACPLAVNSNNFSPSCQLKELILDINQLTNELTQSGPVNQTDEYVCTQCPEGYTGDHCEV